MLEMGPVFRKSKGEDVTAVINLLPDGAATITLKYLDPRDLRDLNKRAKNLAWDVNKREFDAFEEKTQFDVLLADEAVLGFAGMCVEGEEVHYSKENARSLMLHSFMFSNIVKLKVHDFKFFIDKKKEAITEETEKNSAGTSGQ